jgi:hypothetical protein
MRRAAVPIALLLAFLLGGSLLARAMAARAWTAFVKYDPPFAFASPERSATAPVVERVVVVLLDGLTTRGSREMEFLGELRARGADLECRAGQPSLSLPGRGVILTGAWSEVHGQTTNFEPRPLRVEHLFQLARAQRRRTALAAGESPHRLVAGHVSVPVQFAERPGPPTLATLASDLEMRVTAAVGLLKLARPHLSLIELTATDEAGHTWGAASGEYAEAVRLTDAALRRLAAEIDLEHNVLVVTSDHGHTSRGGHGGGEADVLSVPVVLAGGPVRAGSQGQCRQVDLAPTLALLLGVPIPASSQGRPLLDHLDLDPADAADAHLAYAAQRASFAARYAASLLGGDAAPVVALTSATAGVRLAEAQALEQTARQARVERDRRARLPWAMLLILALPAVLILAWIAGVAGSEMRVALLGAVAGLGLYHALFPVVGLGYSFSILNRDEDLGPFFLKDMIVAVASVAVALAGAAALKRRRTSLGWTELIRLSTLVAAGFAGFLWMRIGVVYGLSGIFAPWRLPDLRWAFAFYLDVLAAMAVGFAAPLLPAVAALGALLAGGRGRAAA